MATPSNLWPTEPRAPQAQTPASLAAAAERFEAAGDLPAALEAYETALSLRPNDAELLCGLARLAGRMDMGEQALALWDQALAADPARPEALDGRGRALADLHRYEEAIEALRPAILAHPHEARLWNTLGGVLNQQGDSRAALTFFDEAVRLDPAFAAALYNRGDVRFDLGEAAYAEADFDAAARHAADPGQTTVIAFARALLHLHRGELGAGWDAYEARLSPDHPSAPVFDAPGARWTPATPLDGAHLLVLGEQGVGDEIMFASVLGDAAAALGPRGRMTLATDPRLVGLLQRSFPSARIIPHLTQRREGRTHRGALWLQDTRPVDVWAPLGSLPRRFRRRREDFDGVAAYLRPDPERVAHWRAWLGGRRAVGFSWRSGLLAGRRGRHYPALEAWAPVLGVSDVSFVNLQYGVTDQELAVLDALGARPLLRPPGLDIRNDLDDLAALCLALDRVISVPTATAILAGAVGAPVWFVSGPAEWRRLGTTSYPWYVDTRSFAAERFGEWTPLLAQVAAALEADA